MRAFLLVLVYMLQTVPLAAQTPTKGPEPAWIVPLELPDRTTPEAGTLREAARGGVFFIAAESQIRWTETGLDRFSRVAQEVTDRAGLESAATITRQFDPEIDQVELTRVDIIRDGTRFSVLDKVEIEVYRRETRLDAGIIDGTLTAVAMVPDLRVGDILDYSILHGSRRRFEGEDRPVEATLEFDVPLLFARQIAFWPKEWPLVAKPVPDRVIHVATDLGDVIRHEWRREGHLPPRLEDHTPIEADPRAVIKFSDTDDWSPIIAAIGPHYWLDYPLPDTMKARLDQVAADNPTAQGRAVAALRIVQDEVRYVSLSVGAGGYLARSPAEVLSSGFGDCKDKALLLVTMLRHMGIEAEVALTHLGEGHALPQLLPRLGAFDHMVVRIRIDGNTYWVDPTASHQGGSLAATMPPDTGFALPVVDGPAGLVPIPVPRQAEARTEVLETYEFGQIGVWLEVRTAWNGYAADHWRYQLAIQPISELGDSYLEHYAGRYPGIQRLFPLQASDDRASNTLDLRERYFIPMAALAKDGLIEDFGFGANAEGQALRDAVTASRQTPYLMGRPYRFTHSVRVINAPINFEAPEPLNITNAGFAYTFRGEADQMGGMTLKWFYRTRNRVLSAEEAIKAARDARRIADNAFYFWNLRLTPEQ